MVDYLCEPAHSAASALRRGLEIHETWIDRLVVLSVNDAVDILTTRQLSGAICDALRRSPSGLIIDLTEVTFLASVGMSVLVATHEAGAAMSVRTGVVADGPATSRPMRLLGIDAVLALHPTLEDAKRALAEG